MTGFSRGGALGAWLMAFAVLLGGAPALAQSSLPPPARTPPVAVISLVWGEVTVKHASGDSQPAVWLEPVWNQDTVKTAGPGSKLLITYFHDNHQEVLGPDSEATIGNRTLASVRGGPIRVDKARNPFGRGMENPFAYAMRLNVDSFKGSDAPNAMEQENDALQALVKPSYPPTFSWKGVAGVPTYSVQFFDTTKQFLSAAPKARTPYQATRKQFSLMTLGQTFLWQVVDMGKNTPLFAKYPFMVLGKPQQKWLAGYRNDFLEKKKRGKLERSDYTDYLLVCSQLMQVDEAVKICREMAEMNPNNPRVFRALTRAYLTRSCPAHARQAYDNEIRLGGVDPLAP